MAIGGSNPLSGYASLVSGAFGSRYNFGETLVLALPLVVIAAGAVPALRAGIFTVGAEGQLIIGALVSTAISTGLGIGSAPALLCLSAVGGALAGGLWALFPALLRVKAQVNEILSTLLLNYVALELLDYSLRTWLSGGSTEATLQSKPLPAAAQLPILLSATQLHWGILAAPLALVLLTWWLRTPRGMIFGVLGENADLARRAGLRSGRAIVSAMVVSGAAAGVAGWLQVAGVDGTLYPSVANGLGFSGIIVALLGSLRPLGILAAALVFGAVGAGANVLQIDTGLPASLAVVLQGLLLLFAAVAFQVRRRHRKAAV